MKVVLASRNKHKISELQTLLRKYISDIEILSLDDVGFEGDIVENGKTFEDNAVIKARAVAELGYVGIGDDSGLSVRALGGAPGVYSARYAGIHGDDAANNELLLKNLTDKEDKYAEFICTIACVFPNNTEKAYLFKGVTAGKIIDCYRGSGGFGYDPLFLYEPLNKTFAELTAEEKNSVSHRCKAVELFAKEIKNLI